MGATALVFGGALSLGGTAAAVGATAVASAATIGATASAVSGSLFSGFSFASLGSVLSTVGSLVSGLMQFMGQQSAADAAAKAAEEQAAAMRSQANAQQNANDFANRQATIQAQQQKRAAIQQAQAAQAGIIAAGGNTGTLDTSAVQGGISSVKSQLATNLGVAGQLQQLQNAKVQQENLGYQYAGQAAAAGARVGAAQAEAASAGGIGMLISDIGKGISAFSQSNIFSA